MALSTLSRSLMRQCIFTQKSTLILSRTTGCASLGTTSKEEMVSYWEKNRRLRRPNSPWLMFFANMPMTMVTSFAHRTTGVGLGVALYGAAVGLAVAPGDFASYLELLKSLELGPMVWFPVKMVCAYPIFYHCISGMRHLYWDFGGGYELQQMKKSGFLIIGTALVASILTAGAAYV